jgi:hypothetical protein
MTTRLTRRPHFGPSRIGRARLSLAASLALLGLPLSAHAQLSRLDPVTLIEGLSREGMPELLEHLAASEPPKDPVVLHQIRVAQFRIRSNDQSTSAEQREAALDGALAAMREGIEKTRDHEQRPLWQTDLAEVLLYQVIQTRGLSAAEFVEFGVPTTTQRKNFDENIPVMLEQLIDADLRFFSLRGDLPKESDHTDKRVNTGLWERMINQYYLTRTQFFLAHAAFYATLLPDSNPIWQKLAGTPFVGSANKTPAQLRTRLLTIALEKLEILLKERAPQVEGIKDPVQCLIGRVLLGQGKQGDAIVRFDAVINAGNTDLIDFAARLGKSLALERNKQNAAAAEILVPLAIHQQSKSNLLYRLLSVDAAHLLALRRAQGLTDEKQKQAALAAAYGPYELLIADKSLGDAADPLKNYIYERWEQTITSDRDIDSLPPMVVMAVGEMSRSHGQNLMLDAESAADEPAREKLRKEGQAKLERSERMSQSVLKRENLAPAVRARAMFNQALSIYFRDKTDLKLQLDTAKILTDLAEQLPDQAVAEEAVGGAVTILRPLHTQSPKPAGVSEAYDRTMAVLLNKFPTAAVTDNERLYYGFFVLQSALKYADAAAVYAKVPAGHTDYFTAQQERLRCLLELFRAAPAGKDKDAAATVALDLSKQIADEAANAVGTASPDQAKVIRSAGGTARLVAADLSLERQNLAQGLAILEGFETDYPEQEGLIREVLQRRILSLVEVAQIDRAAEQAQRMMAAFPGDAAPVIDTVLTKIDGMVEKLRKQSATELVERNRKELDDKAAGLATTASRLAKLLLDWASAQKFDDNRMVPFKLILAKSLRLAGKPQESLALVAPMAGKFPDDAEIVSAMGESNFLMGTEAGLAQAAPFYDTIITRVQAENQKYPAIWWNAWMRRLTINDRLKQGTSEIAMRIGQLILIDPGLGGELYKGEFERLRNKHALSGK